MRLRLMDDGLFGALCIGNARFLFLFEVIAKLSPKWQNAAREEAIAERHEADWDERF